MLMKVVMRVGQFISGRAPPASMFPGSDMRGLSNPFNIVSFLFVFNGHPFVSI